MSLINKMLQDLETRERSASPKTPAKSPHESLHPVRYTRVSSSSRALLIALLMVVSLGAAGYYFFGMPPKREPPVAVAIPAAVTSSKAQPSPEPKGAVATQPVEPPPKPGVAPEQPTVPVATAVVVEPVPSAVPEAKLVVPPARPAKLAAAPKPSPSIRASDQVPSVSDQVVIEKQDRPVTPQEQAEAYYREAAQLVARGRADDARATLYAALAAYPGHHKARELAAVLAMQSGRLHEAQDLLSRGLQLAPDNASLAQLLARVQLEQGMESRAIATLESARAAGAGNTDYLSLLAALYQRAGRHADAVKIYRETLATRPQDARSWLGLGISLEATQDTAAASEAYGRALQTGGLDAKLAQYAQQRSAALKK